MTSASEQQAVIVLTLGVATLVSIVVGLWKAATLRHSVVETWDARVEIIVAGLAEKAYESLVSLQRDIATLLGDGMNPLALTHDPAVLSASVGHYQRSVKSSSRLRTYYVRLLKVGPWLIGALVLLAVGVVGATVNYSDVWRNSYLERAAWALLAMGALLGVAVGGVYVHCQARLSKAEVEVSRAVSGA